MPDLARSHAVVIGAGMAGLTAAQAISRHFGKVTIIERDVLPAEAAPRSGTPQAQHAHTLLAGGLQALQTLFPGFENDLAEAGAVQIRTGKDIRCQRPGFDPFPIRQLGIDVFCMSRPLLEVVTRRRVQQSPNINIRALPRVTRLVASRDAMRVEAVRYDSEDGPGVTLEADLVVKPLSADADAEAVWPRLPRRPCGRRHQFRRSGGCGGCAACGSQDQVLSQSDGPAGRFADAQEGFDGDGLHPRLRRRGQRRRIGQAVAGQDPAYRRQIGTGYPARDPYDQSARPAPSSSTNGASP